MNKLIPLAAAVLLASLSACSTIVQPAPGAEKVRITQVPAEVQSCKSVGNVIGRQLGEDKIQVSDLTLRNIVVGDGGDTLLVTQPFPLLAIAYRCTKD